MNPYISISLLLLTVGCSTILPTNDGDWRRMDELPNSMLTDPNVQLSMAHGWEHFTLSAESPLDEKHRVELVKIDPDGSVWIHALDTHEVLKAYPGEPFLGKYQEVGPGLNVRTFGEEGLRVETSDPNDQSATLMRLFGEYKYRLKK